MTTTPVPVLLASQMIAGGGTERQLVECARTLDRSRFQPHVACFLPDPLKRQELEAAGVPVLELPVRSFASPQTIRIAYDFGRYMRRHGIRLFHAFDMPLAVFGAPAARLARIPVVLTSIRGHRDLYSPTHQKMLRLSDWFTHGIVANSSALAEHLTSGYGFPRERVHLCRNGVDTARYAAPPRDFRRRPLRVGSVCVLREEKNLQLLLRAFAALSDRSAMRLQIVGSGPMLEPLQALAADLGLAASELTFSPATNDVAAALRGIDVFVLPSRSEGLSNSIMEAMSAGCFVAASRTGGNPELVDDGRTGCLFGLEDPRELTAVLEMVLSEPDRAAALAQAGVASMQQNFSREASARTMGEIYLRYLIKA